MLNKAIVVVTAAVLLAIVLPRFPSKDSHKPATAPVKRFQPAAMRLDLHPVTRPRPQTTQDSRYSPNLPKGAKLGNRLGITRDDVRRTIRDIETQVPDTMREVRSQVMRDAPTYGLSPTDVESQMRELETETRRQIREMEDDVWREVEENP